MDKNQFVEDLKKSIVHYYKNVCETSPLISFGLYSDGDASTLGIFYNTKEHLNRKLKSLENNSSNISSQRGYYTFFMEEWKEDIYLPEDTSLFNLNGIINDFGSSEYESGNENYQNELFDLFVRALEELKRNGVFKNESEGFFLHIEISDYWIDEKMLRRIALLHPKKVFEEYKKYAESNQY
ncbi:MAG: DUF4303 domain-containing protein [Chitinophagales bacterium]